MKLLTIRVKVTDRDAEALASGIGIIDSAFHGRFEVVGIEDAGSDWCLSTSIDDGDGATLTEYDDSGEMWREAKQALANGKTVRLVRGPGSQAGAA